MESVLTPKDKKCHFGLGSGIQEIQEIENKKQTENWGPEVCGESYKGKDAIRN